HAFYDRSLGPIVNARAELLTSAGSGANSLAAVYDGSGNLIHLVVNRDGTCSDPQSRCSQRYDYHWDEIGRLVRARRWDSQAGRVIDPPQVPPATPDAELNYAYSTGQRVLKSISIAGAPALHSAEIFPSLGLRLAPFNGAQADYARTPQTEIV